MLLVHGSPVRTGQPAAEPADIDMALLVAFVIRERKTAAPVLNLDLLKDRGILGANQCLLAYGACNAGAVLLVTL